MTQALEERIDTLTARENVVNSRFFKMFIFYFYQTLIDGYHIFTWVEREQPMARLGGGLFRPYFTRFRKLHNSKIGGGKRVDELRFHN